MKKIIIFVLMGAGLLMAEVEWRHDYASARNQAQKSGKPMMVLLVSRTCRWCQKLKNRTLQNPEISYFINSRFIPVLVYRGEGGFPEIIHSTLVPTTFFLTPDEKMIIPPVKGYWEPTEYMSDLKLAFEKFKKMQSLH